MTDMPISSPHHKRSLSTGQVMQQVILATIPGLAAMTWFFGWGSLLNIVWLSLWALVFEAAVLSLRKRQPSFYLADFSALVTAVLLGLALPPGSPWWLGLSGIFFAIVFAKHLYGGIGFNPFNPAMVGYVVLLISFPIEMSQWLAPRGIGASPPGLIESLYALFPFLGQNGIDIFTGATALDEFKLQRAGMTIAEFRASTSVLGSWSGLGWEWVNAGFLLGGAYLIWRRIISWQIPAGMLAAMALMALLSYDAGSSASHGSPLFHLFAGATMLGAFFIATDPVSAATTPRGRLVFGALIGMLVFLIRVWGNYPDGVAFAVLLGNFAAPLIDHYTQPRTYGHRGKSHD